MLIVGIGIAIFTIIHWSAIETKVEQEQEKRSHSGKHSYNGEGARGTRQVLLHVNQASFSGRSLSEIDSEVKKRWLAHAWAVEPIFDFKVEINVLEVHLHYLLYNFSIYLLVFEFLRCLLQELLDVYLKDLGCW